MGFPHISVNSYFALKELSDLTSKLSTPDITKKILRVAPALRELSLDDFKNMKQEHRRQAMLAKYQLALMENNIKCYTAVKDNKLDDVCEHGIKLMHSFASLRALFTLHGSERFATYYHQLEQLNSYNHIKKLEFPAGISIAVSNAAFGQTLDSVFDIRGVLYPKQISKHISAVLRSANEAAANKRAMEASSKEEIQKKTPEMSGPMA